MSCEEREDKLNQDQVTQELPCRSNSDIWSLLRWRLYILFAFKSAVHAYGKFIFIDL